MQNTPTDHIARSVKDQTNLDLRLPYNIAIPAWDQEGKSLVQIAREDEAEEIKRGKEFVEHSIRALWIAVVVSIIIWTGYLSYLKYFTDDGSMNILTAIFLLFMTLLLFYMYFSFDREGKNAFKRAAQHDFFARSRQLELENKALEHWMPLQTLSHEFYSDVTLKQFALQSQAQVLPHELQMKALEAQAQMIALVTGFKVENKFENFRSSIERGQALIDDMTLSILDSDLTPEQKKAKIRAVSEMILDLSRKLAMG